MLIKLSKETLSYIEGTHVIKPPEDYTALPVKVLQFGTGVLLRGLPDQLIDNANRQGIFNGRITVIKSTNTGTTDAFEEQDCLYTLLIKGIENEQLVEKNIICSSISQVLSASAEWLKILKEAESPELKLIISNTTEVGIQLVKETIDQSPPVSFPGKLLAILYHRFKVFNGDAASGLVIVPTELLPDNAKVLKGIIMELIAFNNLESAFKTWIENSNYFCNSLVDRIVPGAPNEIDRDLFESKVNYHDDLLIVSEPYGLWAIEGDEKVKAILSFEQADKGVVIVPDIEIYRELKLRLLNGTHSLSCAMAFLSGFETVKNAMDNTSFLGFVQQVMAEIASAIPYQINAEQAKTFASDVIDRFKNPYIRHLWINITQQYTAKLKMRVVPVLLQYVKVHQHIPVSMAMGFAGYLFFMRVTKKTGLVYEGEHRQGSYPVNDDMAGYFFNLWKETAPSAIAHVVLKDQSLWGTDLTELPGFAKAVQENLDKLVAGESLIS